VAFLGEFGTGSLGNDASPLAAVAELRAHDPDVEARFHRDGISELRYVALWTG
jgi:hypothetical protein